MALCTAARTRREEEYREEEERLPNETEMAIAWSARASTDIRKPESVTCVTVSPIFKTIVSLEKARTI
jgi:hypothetical protein